MGRFGCSTWRSSESLEQPQSRYLVWLGCRNNLSASPSAFCDDSSLHTSFRCRFTRCQFQCLYWSREGWGERVSRPDIRALPSVKFRELPSETSDAIFADGVTLNHCEYTNPTVYNGLVSTVTATKFCQTFVLLNFPVQCFLPAQRLVSRLRTLMLLERAPDRPLSQCTQNALFTWAMSFTGRSVTQAERSESCWPTSYG